VFELAAGEVHLCFAFPDEWEDPVLIASALEILDAGEIARMERFHFPAHRQLFLVSHVLLRTTLSRYADIPPETWRFVSNDHGKPRVDPEAGLSVPAFNIAHTAGVAVVAVTRGRDVAEVDRPVFLTGGGYRAGKTAVRRPARPVFSLLDPEGGVHQGAGPRSFPPP
jgi:4'-phosphopantetheinyl transferase